MKLIHAFAIFTAVTFLAGAARANTTDTVVNTHTDLTAAATYSAGLPTAASDVDFAAGAYTPSTFTISGTTINMGTLNDQSSTAIVITDNGSLGILNLSNTGSNGISGNAADLLYVAAGSNLTFQSGTAVLTLAFTVTGSIDNAGTLVLSSPISIAATKAATFTGAGTTTVSGATFNNTGQVIVNNVGGNVIFSGNNANTGGFVLNAGLLTATSNAGALGAGTLTLNGGVLNLTNPSGTNIVFSRSTTATGTSTIISDVNSAGAGNTYSLGTLALSGTVTTAGGANVTSGTAGVSFVGTVTLGAASDLDVVNPATAGTSTLLTVGAITLATNALTIDGTGNLVETGTITSTSTAGRINLGVSGGTVAAGTAFTGTVTFNNGLTYTSTTTINSGTAIENTGTGGLGGAILLGDTTGSNNATLLLNTSGVLAGTITTQAGTTGALTLGNLSATTGAVVGAAIVLNNTLNVTQVPGTTLVVQTGGVTSGSGTQTLNFSSPGQISVTAVIGNGAGTTAVKQSGTGLTTLSGTNTYSGGTTVTNGILTATGTATVLNPLGTGVVTLTGGVLKLNSLTANNLAIGNNVTVNGNSQIISDVTAANTAGDTFTLGTLGIGAQTLTIAGGTNVTSGTAGITFGAVTLSGNSTLNIVDPTNYATARAITLLTVSTITNGANTLTITGNGNFAQTGVFGSGAGGLTVGSTLSSPYIGTNYLGDSYTSNSYSGSATLNQADTYTGTTTVNGGILLVNGTNGAIASSSAYILTSSGTLGVNDQGTPNGNRITNSAPILLNGGTFFYQGTNSATSTETVGAVSGLGASTFTVDFGNANTATVTVASFTHALGNGSDLVNGNNLGKFAGAGSSGFLFSTTTPTLIGTTSPLGGGINSASQNTTIVPFVVGTSGVAATLTGSTGVANTFDTYYTASNVGFRPLNPTQEFTNNSIVATNNTYITAPTTSLAATVAINSLVLNGNNLTIAPGTTLTNTSGALLFVTGNALVSGSYTTGTENMITVDPGVDATISSTITGGAVTVSSPSGAGGILNLTGVNTYTGTTSINNDTVNATTLANGGVASSIGAGTAFLLDNGTLQYTGAAAASTSRNYTLTTNGGSFDASGAGALTISGVMSVTGSVALSNQYLTLTGSGSGVLSSVIVDGTNPTGLTKTGAGTWTLSNTETYTGLTSVIGGTLTLTGSINAASSLVLGGGTLNINPAVLGTQTFNGTAILAGNSTITAPTGETVNLGALTHNIGGTVDFGANGTYDTTTTTNVNGIIGGYATFGQTTWAVAPSVSGGAITGLASGSYNTSLNTFAVVGPNANVDFTATNSGTGIVSQTINSLRFNTAAPVNLLLASGTALTITNGILVTPNVGANNVTINTVTGAGSLKGSVGGELDIIQDDTLGSLTINNVGISDQGAATALVKSGAGTLYIASASSGFTGGFIINGGIVDIAGLNGGVSSLGSNTGDFGPLILNGGFVQYSGNTGIQSNGSLDVDHPYTLGPNGGGYLASGTGYGVFVVNVPMTVTATNGNQTLTLGGTGTGLSGGILATAIVNGAGTNVTNLLKSGSGIWSLGANSVNANTIVSTYTGSTFITGGILQLGTGSDNGPILNDDASIASSSNVVISSGATLQYANNTTNLNYAGDISGAGSVSKINYGSQTLSGASTYTGGTFINQGALIMGNSDNGISGVFGGPGATVNLGNNSGLNASINDNGYILTSQVVAKSGSNGSLLALNGINATVTATTTSTYVGTVTLDNNLSVTQVAGGLSAVTGTVTTAAAGLQAVTFSPTGTGSIVDSGILKDGATTGTLSVYETGTGTTTLSNSNTYTGSTVVNSGTLQLTLGGVVSNVINSATDSSALVLGGGNLVLNGAVGTSQQFPSVIVNPGGSAITNAGGGPGATLGVITRNIGGTANFALGVYNPGSTYYNTTGSVDAGNLLGAGLTYNLNNWATINDGSNGGTAGDIIALGDATYSNASQQYTAAGTIPAGNNSTVNYTTANTTPFTLAGTGTVNTIRLNNTTTQTHSITGTLTVIDGILQTSTVTTAQTISGGSINGAPGADLVVINNGTGALNISSAVVDDSTATAFTKGGTGSVTLSGANTYTGATYVGQGSLVAGVATNAFGSNSSVVVSTGATLNLAGTGFNESVGSLTSANTDLRSDETFSSSTGSVLLGANTLTTAGKATAITTAPDFNGIISGTGTLSMAGATSTSVQVLSGANTYTGGTTITQGTLMLGNGYNDGSISNTGVVTISSGAALDFNTVGTMTYSGSISGAGGLTKTGAGGLTLSPSGTGTNTYTGATTVNEGILALYFTGTSTGSNIISASSPLILGGGELEYISTHTGGYNYQTFASTSFNSGASTVAIVDAGAGGNVTFGAISRAEGATADFNFIGGGGNLYFDTSSSNNAFGILGGWAIYDGQQQNLTPSQALLSGTTWATVVTTTNPGGTQVAGYSNYTTTSAAGTLQSAYAGANVDVTSSPNFTGVGPINPSTFRFNTAAPETVTLQGTNVIQSGGVLETVNAGANADSITGGSITGTATATDLVFYQTNTSGTLTVSSNIIDNSASATSVGLTKSGAGTLIVNGTNSYTGPTTVNAGVLNVNSASSGTTAVNVTGGSIVFGVNNAVASSTPVMLTGGSGNTGGTFAVNGTTQTVGALTLTGVGAANIDVTGGKLILTTDIGTWSPTANLNIVDDNGNTNDIILASINGTTDTTAGFTSAELAEVSFTGGMYNGDVGAQIIFGAGGTSYLAPVAGGMTPVPEPSTVFAAICLLGLLGWNGRRRILALSSTWFPGSAF